MARYTWKSDYFYGNKISDYGLENGYVDYATLAKSFDAVLNNEIMQKTWNVGYWEQVSGTVDNSDEIEELEQEQDYTPEVYQWYIVSDGGAQILEGFGEILYYNEELDLYLWGVTHYGTRWDYVLTDIKIEKPEQF